MKGFAYPIMLGCYDKADKCIVSLKDHRFGGCSLLICRLKKQQEYGSKVEIANIENKICHLHFCRIEAAKAFRDIVTKMVNDWEAENERLERRPTDERKN